MEKSTETLSFGQLVVKHKFASTEQVNECVAIQSQMRAMGVVPKNLGEILLEKNYISRDQSLAILRLQGQEGPQTKIPGYDILSKLGQGAMGSVFKGKQVSMDRFVAIKVLAPRFARDAAFVARFVREARAVAKLHHQNIITGIDVGEHAGINYFVMEFVDGETVGSMLKKSGAMPEKQALNIVL
ncbi:MAG: protein kinase, partial [Planctomycetota bacterium]|nr:protein kinase [Planctomycetota bacterium]